ncbi:MAG: hypothetical protein ABIP95_09670 [Pelobium sp.]
MKNITISLLIILMYTNCIAQTDNGSLRSLVNAEEYFNLLANKDGIKKGYLKVLDKDGIVFRPVPLNGTKFYRNEPENSIELSWKPEYAMIAKTGDFGFTTGPYLIKDGDKEIYGHYVSVWKADSKNIWKLVLNGEISHPKPSSEIKFEYNSPLDNKYPRLMGPKKIQMREDIVMSTDILLGKALSTSGIKNLYEFYDDKVRVYFPGHLPVIGRNNALKFIKEENLNMTSKPDFADRAFSGDMAYTYGTAEILGKHYSYVRIWKIAEEMKWNIILDVYMLQ